MRRSCFALSVALALAVATGGGPSADASPAAPVTACGQVVGDRGVLVADLDCSTRDGAAITLWKGARLDLGGFTLTAKDIGVHCDAQCEVRGPGAIRRPAYDPELDFFNGQGFGIRSFGRVRVRDVFLQHWNQGVWSLSSASVRGCTILDGFNGAVGGPVSVADSGFTGNRGAGVRAYEGTRDGIHYSFYACRVRRSTFAGNGVDIESYRRPSVKQTTCTTSDQLTIPSTPYGGGDEWGICPLG